MNPLRQLSLADLRTRGSEKWRAYPEDVLPLWVAEMDTLLAEPVHEALETAIASGDTGYPDPQVYVEAAAGFAKTRWDWAFDTDLARVVPDVMQGAMEVLHAQRAEVVVINPPVYPPYYEYLAHTGRRVVEAPLQEGRLDLPALERAFAEARPGRTSYLLCSPHNPTGTVHTAEELRAVAGLAKEYGVRVVVDEIHAPLTYDAAFVPYLSVGDDAVVLLSASKAWNLAGLKAAVAVAGPGAADDVTGFPELVSMGASYFGVLSHTAAYTHGTPWLEDLLAGLDENRRLLGDLLARQLPEVGYRMPAGTYLGWLDCRGLGLGDDPAAVFLERGRVAFTAGRPFGTGGAGFVRFNFATHPDLVEEAVRRMVASL